MTFRLSQQDWDNLENNLKKAIKSGKDETTHYKVADVADSNGFQYKVYLYAKEVKK